MIRTCKVVTERFGRVIAKEYTSGIIKPADIFKRFFNAHFKMLRCKLICKINSLVKIFANNNFTVIVKRFFYNFLSFKEFNLPVYFSCS